MPQSNHRRAFAVLAGVALLAGGCELPDQSTVPPTVRLTYTSGSATGTVDETSSLPVQHVAPGEVVEIDAEAYSSLAGMQSLEVDAEAGFSCREGDVGQSGSPDYAPVINAPPASSPVTLHLSANFSLGRPSAWCKSLPFAGWGASVKAIAISRNGLKTTSQVLKLASP